MKKFVEFYLTKVKDLAAEVKYVPLPDAAYSMGLERFAKLETGSRLRRQTGGRPADRGNPQTPSDPLAAIAEEPQ